MNNEQNKLRNMLLTKNLNSIPKSSCIYIAFWNGFHGLTAYKYFKDSLAGIAHQAGIDRAKLEKSNEIVSLLSGPAPG
jgi:hypothetical protein